MISYKLYGAGLSLQMVVDATGIKKSTLQLRLKKIGALRSGSEAMEIAKRTGRHRTTFTKGRKGEPWSEEFREKMKKAGIPVEKE